ncbi:MAG: hypothetical protein ACFB5Z_00325 [Elainellaceae cyanobacterium]
MSLNALGLLAIASAAPAAAVTVEAGGIRAEYTETAGDICIESPQLTITREDAIAFEGVIASELGICRRADRFEVRDLDQDDEPEVLIDFYTGGAHCCWFTQVYRYSPDQEQYLVEEQFWGNGGSASLQDIEGDGQPEFISRDDRFAYQFAAYADSAFPPQIWQYSDGTFTDVTRQYPDQVYDLTFGLWQRYERTLAQGGETRGVLAAYLAAKHLLDQAEDGWQRVQAAYTGGDRPQYFSDLSTFLQQTGYTAAAPSAGFSRASDGSSDAAGEASQNVPTEASLSGPMAEASVLLEQQGSLDPGDSILPTDGSLYDEHSFTADAGDIVLIRMESAVFDPYIFLVGPQGELIAQNDDVSESELSAVLVLTLPQSGEYRAIANSYNSTGRGAYQITVRRRQIDATPADATTLEESLEESAAEDEAIESGSGDGEDRSEDGANEGREGDDR